MTLPQISPQGLSEWVAAVNNAVSSLSDQSGALLGYVHQANMPNVEFGSSLANIPDLSTSFIVPNSGLVEVHLQTLISHSESGSEYIDVGVSLDFGITSKQMNRQWTDSGVMLLTTMVCALDPGSSVTLYGGIRTGDSSVTGILYRSSGAACLMVVRAL